MKKSSRSNSSSDKVFLASSSIQSLQISLNNIEQAFQELEERKMTLKHKLKTSIFSQIEKDPKFLIDMKHLSNFVNNKTLTDSELYKNLNLIINLFEHHLNKKLIDRIAKKAISIYFDQVKTSNQS